MFIKLSRTPRVQSLTALVWQTKSPKVLPSIGFRAECTWGSTLCSSCKAGLRQGSRGVLVAGRGGSAAPGPWAGRGQRPRRAGRLERG